MTVKEFAEKYHFNIVCGNKALSREIETGFCCDLLSLAMAKAPENGLWFTVMGNLNSVAVASLTDVSAIVLCQGVKMDSDGLAKAVSEDIAILETELPIFDAVCRTAENF